MCRALTQRAGLIRQCFDVIGDALPHLNELSTIRECCHEQQGLLVGSATVALDHPTGKTQQVPPEAFVTEVGSYCPGNRVPPALKLEPRGSGEAGRFSGVL